MRTTRCFRRSARCAGGDVVTLRDAAKDIARSRQKLFKARIKVGENAAPEGLALGQALDDDFAAAASMIDSALAALGS